MHLVQFCCDGCNTVAGNKNKGKLDDISGRKFVLMIVLSVFQGYTSMGVDNSAHIGGLIMGFLLCMILSIGVKQSEDDYLTYD